MDSPHFGYLYYPQVLFTQNAILSKSPLLSIVISCCLQTRIIRTGRVPPPMKIRLIFLHPLALYLLDIPSQLDPGQVGAHQKQAAPLRPFVRGLITRLLHYRMCICHMHTHRCQEVCLPRLQRRPGQRTTRQSKLLTSLITLVCEYL